MTPELVYPCYRVLSIPAESRRAFTHKCQRQSRFLRKLNARCQGDAQQAPVASSVIKFETCWASCSMKGKRPQRMEDDKLLTRLA